MTSVLEGLPLRYVIGIDSDPGVEGMITEVGYDATDIRTIRGIGIKYCNLFDQRGSYNKSSNTGDFGPYLDPTDTAEEYDEGVIDPNGAGWKKNLEDQFTRAKTQGTQYIELDNCDAYKVADVLRAVELAAGYGLKVIAKNPGSMDEDALPIIAHSNIYGIIVERGAGTPIEMETLRKRASKPTLPVWFVAFADGEGGEAWARDIAQTARFYRNMGVTFDRAVNEYGGDIEFSLKPIPASTPTDPTPMPTPAVTSADILAKARAHKGKLRGDGPDITMMAKALAVAYPDMASYTGILHEDTEWCGIFNAYIHMLMNIRPAYTKNSSDYDDFAWADAPIEGHWGTQVTRAQAKPGDTVVLRVPHHITFLDKDDGGDTFQGTGGNQGGSPGAVTTGAFKWANIRAIVRAPGVEGSTTGTIDPHPELVMGATGDAVKALQLLLGVEVDGEFGPDTKAAVMAFQEAHGLDVDGEVGPITWAALLAPVEPPTGGTAVLSVEVIGQITALAGASPLARYSWNDRGRAPVGYIKGVAATFAKVCLDLKAGRSAAMAMTGSIGGSKDSLAWYGLQGTDRPAILRALFSLLYGLGMRESSGNYSEGRDTTASNLSADTAEAGLFQQSWNSHSSSVEFAKLLTAYRTSLGDGFLSIFREGVTNKASANIGSGDGAAFQALCKSKPAFAVEAAAICLRVLGGSAGHFGPIRRREAEVRPEADALLKQIQVLVDRIVVEEPPPPPPPPPPVDEDVDKEVEVILQECLVAMGAVLRPILKKHAVPEKPAMTTQYPIARSNDPIIGDILENLRRLNANVAATPPPPVQSTIDTVLGGQATMGMKTMTGVLGLIGTLFGLPAAGIDVSGGLFNILTGGFALLTSAGFIAKVDRALKMANDIRNALQKLAALQDQSRLPPVV